MTQQLYRLYNAADELLYIGVSRSAIRRLTEHSQHQPWWLEVARVDIQTHDVDRSVIEAMERAAIQAERPKYNVTHAGTTGSSASRKRPERRKVGKSTYTWLEVGDVVAVGIRNEPDCPVGMIVADSISDSRLAFGTFVLQEFHFGTGYFDADIRVICSSEVGEMRAAVLMDEWDHVARKPTGERIWNMDPLGRFQTDWKRRHAKNAA